MIRKLLKEPLLQFLVLGALIFFASSYISQRRHQRSNTITINDAIIGRMVLVYHLQNNGFPAKKELDTLIEQYINDEIMYREAGKMALSEDDEIIRRRLIQKYEFIYHDVNIIKEPDEPTLRRFYTEHQSQFSDPAKISFTHIYFNADRHGNDATIARASSILRELQQKNIHSAASEKGDHFGLQYDYKEIDKLESLQLFGNTEMTKALFNHQQGTWFGPVRSGYGYHLVLITKFTPGQTPDYKNIKDRVKDLYMNTAVAEKDHEKFSSLKDKYNIDRDYLNHSK